MNQRLELQAKEGKVMYQRLTDLESKVNKEDREKVRQLDDRSESFSVKSQNYPSESFANLNNTFQDYSFANSSLDIQKSDVVMEDLNIAKPIGKLATHTDFNAISL